MRASITLSPSWRTVSNTPGNVSSLSFRKNVTSSFTSDVAGSKTKFRKFSKFGAISANMSFMVTPLVSSFSMLTQPDGSALRTLAREGVIFSWILLIKSSPVSPQLASLNPFVLRKTMEEKINKIFLNHPNFYPLPTIPLGNIFQWVNGIEEIVPISAVA